MVISRGVIPHSSSENEVHQAQHPQMGRRELAEAQGRFALHPIRMENGVTYRLHLSLRCRFEPWRFDSKEFDNHTILLAFEHDYSFDRSQLALS